MPAAPSRRWRESFYAEVVPVPVLDVSFDRCWSSRSRLRARLRPRPRRDVSARIFCSDLGASARARTSRPATLIGSGARRVHRVGTGHCGQARRPRSGPSGPSAVSMSARITSSTCSTPRSPRPATAHAQARPSSTARAPSAISLTASRPLRTPAVGKDLDTIADRFGDRPERRHRGRDAVELAAAVVGDDHGVDAGVGRGARASCDVENALDGEARRANVRAPMPMSRQVTAGSNWESTHSRKSSGRLAPGTAPSRFPNVSALPHGRPPHPRGCETRSSVRRAREPAPTASRRGRCACRGGALRSPADQR